MRWLGLLFLVLVVNAYQTASAESYSLKVRAFLQGAYSDDTPGLMHDTLRKNGLVPANQPFNNYKFAYTGTESLDPAMLEDKGSDAVVDWVLVELRDPDDPTTIAVRKAVLLQRDGDTLDIEQAENVLSFTGLEKTRYYIGVHHRNHLGTMTASPIEFSTDEIVSVDFTATDTATGHLHDRVLLANGNLALRAGYINNDQRVIASGPGNDLSEILTEVLTAEENISFNTNFISGGYSDSDLNLDGKTTFAGPGNDAQMLIGNILLYPENTDLAANFVINSMQKDGVTLTNEPLALITEQKNYELDLRSRKSHEIKISGTLAAEKLPESVYLKITNDSNHIGDRILNISQSASFKAYMFVNTYLPRGFHKSKIELQACKDQDCQTVYSNSKLQLDFSMGISVNNTPPVADPGLPLQMTANLGDSIRLDGSGTDDDGDYLSDFWAVTSPPSSTANQEYTDGYRPWITFDKKGIYKLEFFVSDGVARSESVIITVDVSNSTPIAKPKHSDQLVTGTPVILDAHDSYDPDDDSLTHEWILYPPDGSVVTLDSPTGVEKTFIPDIPGYYLVRYQVKDGKPESKDPDRVDFNYLSFKVIPSNYLPVASSPNQLQVNLGQTALLDGSASSDPDEDELTYHWALVSAPENSESTLLNSEGEVAEFIPDFEGEYQFQLTVNDGSLDSEPVTVNLNVHKQIQLLAYQVIDAEFSKSLNRIVTVSTAPNRLHIIDPTTQIEINVDLPVPPRQVSVSPDGKFAAVGHDAWVSHIDLENAERLNTFSTSADSLDIALDGNRVAHILANYNEPEIHSVNLTSGQNTVTQSSLNRGSNIKLHASGKYLLAGAGEYHFHTLSRFDLQVDKIKEVERINLGSTSACNNLWLSEDGRRFFSCNKVFRNDFLNDNSKGRLNNGGFDAVSDIEHLVHSAAANRIFIIGENSSTIHVYGYDYLDLQHSIHLVPFVHDAVVYNSVGQFVFVNKTGEETYVITQAKDSEGAVPNAGIQIYQTDYKPPSPIDSTASELIAKTQTTVNTYSGNTVVLDGSESLGNIQQYHWELLDKPESSTVSLNWLNSEKISLTPDHEGKYTLSLIVSDGEKESEPLVITLMAYPFIGLLNHSVIDAEYSHSLDRIISVGTLPDKLYILDPVVNQSTEIKLDKPPKAVSVSLDGLYAAVGHDGLITHVDLVNGTKTTTVIDTGVADIVLADNNYVYTIPTTKWRRINSINLITGEESHDINEDIGMLHGRLKLHPEGQYAYVAVDEALAKFDVSQGNAEFLASTGFDEEFCGDLWMSENGSRIFNRCHLVHGNGSDSDETMSYSGKLEGLGEILHLTHSAATKQVLVIPDDYHRYDNPNEEIDSRTLTIYDDVYLQPVRTIDLHDFVADKRYDAHGRFVFANSAGTKVYVIAQANMNSGMLNDHGLLTYSPDFQVLYPDALTENQTKWQAATRFENNFFEVEYEIQLDCECSSDMKRPIKITENAHEFGIAWYPDDRKRVSSSVRSSLMTINERFEQLHEAYNTWADKIEVNYDPQNGYPTSVFIDYNEFVSGDEISYTISDLSIKTY